MISASRASRSSGRHIPSACGRSGARRPSGCGRPRCARPSPAHRRRCRAAVRAGVSVRREGGRIAATAAAGLRLWQAAAGEGVSFGADAVAGHPRGKALHDFFNRRRLSVDMKCMVFSLVMRKPARFQAAKNRPQKALAFFYGSARVGIATSLLLQFQFLKARLLAGFLFLRHGFSSVVVTGESRARNRVSTF